MAKFAIMSLFLPLIFQMRELFQADNDSKVLIVLDQDIAVALYEFLKFFDLYQLELIDTRF